VDVGTPTDVTFTVTDSSGPVEGAEITLTDCATGTGTTCAAGTAVISVNATDVGTITATASKDGYTSADTIVDVKGQNESSSSVSLSVKIIPVISFVVKPDKIDFGDLSPGDTSDAHTLTLENNGGSGFTVTAQVSDKKPTEDTLFKNGLLLDSTIWGDYTISIDAGTSDDTNASLSVPVDMGPGPKHGELVFWAEA
jgi:hypothetical protein